jgi:DnaJ-class molecular chaperone
VRDVLGSNLSVTIPPRTQPGTILRLKGRGLRDKNGRIGDLQVKIQAQLPEYIDPEIIDVISQKTRT